MTVECLAKQLELETLCLPEGERKIQYGYCGDLLSWVMGRAKSGNAWITIMNNINVVAVASLADVSCVIFAEGTDVPDEVIKRAEAQGINLLRSERPAYELCGRIYKLCDE